MFTISAIRITTCLALLECIGVGACGSKKVSDRSPTARGFVKMPTGTKVSTTASRGGVKATLDPNSSEAQLISLDSGELSGVTVAFPAGSLSIPMTVTVSPGAAVSGATMLQNLGVSGNTVTGSGTPIDISASAGVDLKSPMVLAIPVPGGTGLVSSATDRTRMAIFYRVKVSEGDSTGSYTGIVPATSLGFDNGKILFETKYFGWFAAVTLENPAPVAIEVKARYADQVAASFFGSKSDLPACTSADLNRVAYVSDEKALYYCAADKNWTVMTVAATSTPTATPAYAGPNVPIAIVSNTTGKTLAKVISVVSGSWKLVVYGATSGMEYLADINIPSANKLIPLSTSDMAPPAMFSIYFAGSSTNCDPANATSMVTNSYGASESWFARKIVYASSIPSTAIGFYSVSSTGIDAATTQFSYDSYNSYSSCNGSGTISSGTYYSLTKVSESLTIFTDTGGWDIKWAG